MNIVTNKIAKISGILNRLKHIFPQNVLLSLYHTRIISHINYGMLFWGSDIRSVDIYKKSYQEYYKQPYTCSYRATSKGPRVIKSG